MTEEPRHIYPRHFFRDPVSLRRTGFILMPFAAEFDDVHVAIRQAIESAGLEPVRADDIFTTRASLEKILRGIAEAELVVADMTGRNPNVFYEVGIAHTVKENVVLIAQNVEVDVPFDLRHIDHLQYQNTADGRDQLAERLSNIVRELSPEVSVLPAVRSGAPGPVSHLVPDSERRATLSVHITTSAHHREPGNRADQAQVHIAEVGGSGEWWPPCSWRSEYTATLAHYLMLNAAIGNSYAVTASFPSGKFLQRSVTLYDTETTLLLAFE